MYAEVLTQVLINASFNGNTNTSKVSSQMRSVSVIKKIIDYLTLPFHVTSPHCLGESNNFITERREVGVLIAYLQCKVSGYDRENALLSLKMSLFEPVTTLVWNC